MTSTYGRGAVENDGGWAGTAAAGERAAAVVSEGITVGAGGTGVTGGGFGFGLGGGTVPGEAGPGGDEGGRELVQDAMANKSQRINSLQRRGFMMTPPRKQTS